MSYFGEIFMGEGNNINKSEGMPKGFNLYESTGSFFDYEIFSRHSTLRRDMEMISAVTELDCKYGRIGLTLSKTKEQIIEDTGLSQEVLDEIETLSLNKQSVRFGMTEELRSWVEENYDTRATEYRRRTGRRWHQHF